jgi:tetratricopeptide (TPR) repeat protein
VQEALPFFQRAGHRKWLAVALTLLGRVHRDRGEYDAALRAFNEQLRIGARVGDASQEAVVHTEIGSVLKRQERYPEALDHFDKSATISTSLNAKVSVGYALMERAGVLWQLGRFDDAKSALDEATANAGPEGAYKGLLAEIPSGPSPPLLERGPIPGIQGESQRAIDLAADQYSDIATEAAVTLGLAETRSGNARAAVRSTQKTVTMATDTGDPLLLSSARLALAEALLSVGDAKSSLGNSKAGTGKLRAVRPAGLGVARVADRGGIHSATGPSCCGSRMRCGRPPPGWRVSSNDSALTPMLASRRGQTCWSSIGDSTTNSTPNLTRSIHHVAAFDHRRPRHESHYDASLVVPDHPD